MKAFAITNPGLEEISAKEIEELIDVKTKTEHSVVIFEATEEKIAYLAYKAQSLIKVCSLLENFNLEEASDLEKIKTDFTKVIQKGKSFRVKSAKQNAELSSQELEPELGDFIFKQFKEAPTVSLNNPDLIVYLYIFGTNAYVGIDYCGFDLSKRDYRVFANPKSLHANIPYSLLRLADIKDKQTIIDAFCLSGETGIETALYLSHKSPHYFSKSKFAFNKFMELNFEKADKEVKNIKSHIIMSSQHMADIKAAQKNAKIAGVEKLIDFTRQDVEWLDFKVKKSSVDRIISQIPCPSFNVSERNLTKMYSDFLFQIKHALAKNGKVAILGKAMKYFKSLAKELKIIKEIKFMNGQEDMEMVVFEKAQ